MTNAAHTEYKGTVFFDYDGTIHDSMRVYGPAFHAAYDWLVSEGYAEPKEYDDEWISHWLGWTVEDMWTTFLPDLPEPAWRHASHIIGDVMSALTNEGKGSLFPGITDSLQQLKDAGYKIVLLSNCVVKYCNAHRQTYGLDEWFSHYYCAEDYPGLAKWEIYQQVKDNEPYPHCMVGDRFHDLEVAYKANIPAIGCRYGFGMEDELEAAAIIVDDPAKVAQAAMEVL